MPLIELMQIDMEVTTVSKKPQKVHQAASAVYVITQEDIRRSGATTIMEALRLVPGVLVSKINQNSFAISVRGFNRRFGSNKLLVMIDGRSIYSPLFAGVNWVRHDYVLEDIDRIEVVRGPGAALWGFNAVAGVINILTKTANETQGIMFSGGGGTEERGFGAARYGGKIGDDFNYRLYAKYRDRDQGVNADGAESFDDKQMGQFGFRTDWQANDKDQFTFQGDYVNLDRQFDLPSRVISLEVGSEPFKGGEDQRGANILGRWTRDLEDDSKIKFQSYYDRSEIKTTRPENILVQQGDFDLQYDFSWRTRHNVSVGANYRFVSFDIGKTITSPRPDLTNITTDQGGFWFHDEIAIIPEKLNLILGSRFSHNDFSGFEVQPNIRMAWHPQPNHTLWASASRAVRIPTLLEERQFRNRIVFPAGVLGPQRLVTVEDSDGRTDAERLLAYEVGYKFKSQDNRFSFDVTAFLFEYDDLIDSSIDLGNIFFTTDPNGTGANIPILKLPVFSDNAFDGEAFGMEFSSQWQATERWRLSTGYAFTKLGINPIIATINRPSSEDPNAEGEFDIEGEPDHILNARSYLTLPYNLEIDTMFFWVSGNSARSVNSYERLDLRLGWKPRKDFELSLVGQNILDPSHFEQKELLERSSQTQRSFYVKATFRF